MTTSAPLTQNRGKRIFRTCDYLQIVNWWLALHFTVAERMRFYRELALRSGFSRSYCTRVCHPNTYGRPAMNWIICREALKLQAEFNAEWEARNSPEGKRLRALEQARKRAVTATAEVARLEREIRRAA